MQAKELNFVKSLEEREQVTIISEIDGGDGWKYATIQTKNPKTNAEHIFLIKYSETGFVKSIFRVPVGVAKQISTAILERVK